MKFVARINVLERHPDGTARQFQATRIIDDSMTIRDLMRWRDVGVHDPINGEYASREVIITPDDGEVE
jgi:hypothetical protein